MVSARRSAEVTGALADGKRKAGPAVSGSPHALLALQRDAGNAAVGALMAAKQKQPDPAALGHIDAALEEVRGSEPEIDTVEKGLKAAQSAGVPVTLEGPKPPASALAVTTTGFGPNAVQPKKPVPPAKPVPAKSKLGTAAARPAAKSGGASAKPAAAPAVPAVAAADPAFMQVTEKVKGVAAAKKAHPPAAAKAKEAQDAAQAPADDLAGQAKASKVDSMDAQQAGSFDKQAFIAAVKTAIEAKSPKTLQEGTSPQGKADGVASEVKGMVSQGKEGQAKDIEAATDAAPDQSKAVPKPVTPMAQENPGAAPAIPAAGAAPKPAPPSQTDLTAGKQQVAQEQGDVTDEQMRQSNEPQFHQALDAKQTAASHADTAPAQVRAQEQQVIGQAKADAGAVTAGGVAGMQGAKGAALAKLVADKGKTKTKDEAKRAEVTTRIQGIFAATETEVKKILGGIDAKVETEFTKGEAAARQAFESFVAAKVNAYKQDRYSGWLGGYRWIKDKVLSVPDKVNEFYTAGRELYLKQMDGVISRVADIVGNDLSLAKQKIATGKAEIAAFVKTLSPDLQKVGADASAEINDRFEQLESDVTDKQNAVVDTLATKYTEARQAVDERIEALQAENKGFVDAAIDAVKGVVNTIRELAAMLRDVLSRAAAVVGDIVKKPVEFLGNLIAGVKGGILKFKDNILEHLRKGLMGWLFGALADAGIELPEKFDVRGIIKLLASIFGLTWSNIRSRLVRQIGEKAMAAAEKGVEIFQVLTTQGVSGLWQMLMEKLSDIKETILAQVKDFVITKIITVGITWLIGLLNPAAAFIKACKLIYDVVMFFVTNGSRIMKFVNTVIDSVADIVRGNVGGVVDKINDVLGQMVPIIIGFLASAIGLGGIGAKIRSILETLQKPVNKALDWVIKKGLTLAGPIIKAAKGVGAKVKAKVAAGKAWVKGKATGAVAAVRDWLGLRKTFQATDGTHTLYWEGRGTAARLTVASTPTPVESVLVTATRLITSGHAQHAALQAAKAKQAEIRRLKRIVEAGRVPTDVDALNNAMNDLATLMIPLVPILFPATATTTPGSLKPWVQPFNLVKLKKENRYAMVTAIDRSTPVGTLVRYQIIRPRLVSTDGWEAPTRGRTGGPEAVSPSVVESDWEEYVDDRRNFYLGPTQSKTSKIGKQVEARMRAEGKIVGNEVLYARSATGTALPPGQVTRYPLSACVMGHLIDAVTWWNSNGRFTGPQSSEARRFMEDPDNYEIEPSGPNSLRGALLGGSGVRYLPSTK
ncbi:phage tail protein [Lentzea sp. NPDC054927]